MKFLHWLQIITLVLAAGFLCSCATSGTSGSADPNLAITTTTALPNAAVSQPYSVTLQASGGTAPYSWNLVGGSLPDGLNLSPDGQIAGTPTQTGSFSFQAQVSDKAMRKSSSGFGVTVGGPGPTISGISPASGSTAGGTTVTISGNKLQSGATITFGGTSATSVNVSSSSQMTAVTPAHAAGLVDVVVTNPGGETATLSGGFGYGNAVPTVSAVSPNSGPTTGGTSVKITGSNFATGALVFFGTIAATGITIAGPTQIQATTPADSTAGAVSVVVQNSDGQSGNLANGFTYTAAPSSSAPTVSGISPSSATPGTAVNVDGTNFAWGATVTIGNTAASNVQFMSPTQLTASVPNVSPGTYSVTVANTNGLSATLSSGLVVADPQSLLSGCTVSSTNTVNWGVGNCPASDPSGWTLVQADGFSGGKLANASNESIWGYSPECTLSHDPGGCALAFTYTASGNNPDWKINQGVIGSSYEVYVSWWEYDTAGWTENYNANNDIIGFKYTASNGDWTDSHFDRWGRDAAIGDSCLNGLTPGPDYNCQNGRSVNETTGIVGGAGQSGINAYYGPMMLLDTGAWDQYEAHFSASTGTSANGQYQLYKNGQLILSVTGVRNSYLSSMAGMSVIITGDYEDPIFTDSGKTTCETPEASGNVMSYPGLFNSYSPCPSPTQWTKYLDDIIILKR